MERWNLEPDRWAWELTEVAKRDGEDLSKLKDHEMREALKWCAANHARHLETEAYFEEIRETHRELFGEQGE